MRAKDGTIDSLYKPCVEDGLSCHDAAERDLKQANPGNRIGRMYVYRTDEAFGSGLYRCPEMEHAIEVGKRVYYRLITQADGSDDATCDFSSKAQSYDMILVAGSPSDSLKELLDLGDQFGMRVFPALPLAPRDHKTPIRAERRHLGTLTTLTRRIVQDYGARFAGRESLGGVYQPFEVQMSATLADNPTLEVYSDQHRIVQQELSGKPILISPYLDARKRVAFGQTPQQVAEGFKALVRTGGSASSRRRTAGAPARSACSGPTSATTRWTSGCGPWWASRRTRRPTTAPPATTTAPCRRPARR
ncbi:DUF4434 domain-containing protein [Nonomuraea salmonea]|uniref:DUF4434 domain-containing protein n=1 Tax=Nonomuraea salmonea TaxID=46181 RepID=UPI002FED00E1